MNNKSILLIMILSVYSNLFAKANVQFGQQDNWVNTIAYKDSAISYENGGYQFVLLDAQDNIKEQSMFRHYAIKIVNSEGVQEKSDCSFEFDPSYQTLKIHYITIIRDGKSFNKLDKSSVRLLQRETSHERALYDGTTTAVVNLSDVQIGDVIEYAYTIKGFNPIEKGKYTITHTQQYVVPVNRVYNRIIDNGKDSIVYKLFGNAVQPQIINNKGTKELLWNINSLDFKIYDSNVPNWYNFQKRVSITNYKNWEDVENWIEPLYHYKKDDFNYIKKTFLNRKSSQPIVSQIITFVQDEIRYLGFESGIGAYKPNDPKKVFKQRYGDCKDKSLFLCALLRSEGIEAYPLLVNNTLEHETKNKLPSVAAFNHCVTEIIYEGKKYYIDPTYSNQGGDLETITFPNYKYGLLVKKGEKELIELPDEKTTKIEINELITVDSVGGSATLYVETDYYGDQADYFRSFFKQNSKESINKYYVNYYSKLYPTIKRTDDIQIIDTLRSTTNIVKVKEFFSIEKYWDKEENSSELFSETYPLVLSSYSSFTKSTNRTMPYYIGGPIDISQNIVVDIPEIWEEFEVNDTIKGAHYNYTRDISLVDTLFTISHKYSLDKSWITAKETPDFLVEQNTISDKFTYYVSSLRRISHFQLSWISLFFFITPIVPFILLFLLMNNRLKPKVPLDIKERKFIGGWLMIPFFSLPVSTVVQIKNLFGDGTFGQQMWMDYYDYGFDLGTKIMVGQAVEIIGNTGFIVFSIFLVYKMYSRKNTFPKLIVLFLSLNIVWLASDFIFLKILAPSLFDDSDIIQSSVEIGSSIFSAMIWIPYFLTSKRVKETFTVE